MPHIDIQRSWVVADVDSGVHNCPSVHIVQGYLVTPPATSLRVRIVDGRRAFVTGKRGVGVAREEEEKKVPLDVGEMLLGYCSHRLEKRRAVRDGWEIDVFLGRLNGLMLAQRELESVDEQVVAPSWLTLGREVTGRLTNLHLAIAAYDLDEEDKEDADALPPDLARIVPVELPRFVFTGGPCSGKSSIMRLVEKRFGERVHCLPELASVIIHELRIPPPTGFVPAQRRYQRMMARVQRSCEMVSMELAAVQGKRVLAVDRGTVDCAAYMPEGVSDFERMMHCDVQTEYAQYAAVFMLAVPAEEVYRRAAPGNPARRETYAEAMALEERIIEVWGDHPNFIIIDPDDWEEKVAAALWHVEQFIRKYR